VARPSYGALFEGAPLAGGTSVPIVAGLNPTINP
jgi:hypothetical protein